MQRKIFCLVVSCLFLTCAKAQQEKALQLIHKIRVQLATVSGDSTLSQDCKKNIGSLQNELPSKKAVKLDSQKINYLLNTSVKFGKFFTTAAGKACTNPGIDSVTGTTKLLVAELDLLKNTTPTVHRDSTARISILIVDSVSKQPVAATLSIDSAGISIKSFTSIKDSTGQFNVTLVLNRQYTIHAGYDHYDAVAVNYTAKKNGAALTIGMHSKAIVEAAAVKADTVQMNGILPPAPLSSRMFNFVQDYPIASVAAIILFILILLAAIFYINVLAKSMKKTSGKRLSSIINPARVFQHEINRKELLLHDINKNLEVAESSLAAIRKNNGSTGLPFNKTIAVETIETTGRYFLNEIMMTAGPRKKTDTGQSADIDLGEDVCGFIATAAEVLIWLLDGTSDAWSLRNRSTGREYFSSRLLAQCIAEKLRKHFEKSLALPLEDILNDSIASVKSDWLQAINQLQEEEKLNLKTNLASQVIPDCSCTILLGRLSINGDFTGYRIGDSKLFLFRANEKNEINFVTTSFAVITGKTYDRLFFYIELDEKGNFDITYTTPKFEAVTETGICTAVAFSDGIGADTEQALIEKFKETPGEIRHEIISHVQGTGDDKSICFLEIKQLN